MRKDSESKPEIILASRSPQRRKLLSKILQDFRVVPSEVDEESFRDPDPVRFALRAAEAKAKDVGEKFPSSTVLAADTLVFLDGEILGKPKDGLEARRMLEKLSGKRHRVITAVVLYQKNEDRLLAGYETSEVRFKPLSDEEMESFLQMDEFVDKAGGYAIQKVGDAFVAELKGDYDNVVGLPVRKVKRLFQEFLRPELVVEITDIAFPHGWGVAAGGTMVTFVPNVLPGDKVRVRVTAQKRKYRFARAIRLESLSPFRVDAECPHFGACGGCTFQNLAYAKQLELKEKYVLRTLQAIGRVEVDGFKKEPIVASPDLYFYRNKMEYAFGGEGREIFLGLRSRTSPLEKYEKRTIALQKCPIFSRVVETIFPMVTAFAKKTGFSPYHPLTHQGYFRNLVLREGKNTGEILAVLVTRSGPSPDFSPLAAQLKENVPQLKSFWTAETDWVSDVVDFRSKKLIAGSIHIEEKLDGLRFRIGPEDFFQPNPKAAEILYRRILEEAKEKGSSKALGLYCGPGSIEMFLSRAVDEVVGIDAEPMNIERARENCELNGIDNCSFMEGRIEQVLKEVDGRSFDFLVIDPPRSGISPKGLTRIVRLNIPVILYVSCNPAALARDLSVFIQQGYRLGKLTCFDFFPHTPHLESLAVLTKS